MDINRDRNSGGGSVQEFVLPQLTGTSNNGIPVFLGTNEGKHALESFLIIQSENKASIVIFSLNF